MQKVPHEIDRQARNASAPTTATGDAMARRHRRVAGVLGGIVVAMIGMAYAAVPLYRIFCQMTGYGGTPQIAVKGADKVLDRTITVRFDANVAPGLPWSFTPKQRTMDVRLGETSLAHYSATNTSDKPLRGTASFNVTPDSAGPFFNKLECFCFTEQLLQPGQSIDMPVSFFIDPAIIDDSDARKLSTVTLSYTFHPMDKASTAASGASETRAEAAASKGRS